MSPATPSPTRPRAPGLSAFLRHAVRRGGLLAATGAVVLFSACTTGGWEATGPLQSLTDAGILFIVQSEEPNVVPDALFQGRIEADGEGCLRLETGDGTPGSTVVWRPGFVLETAGEDHRVRAPDGSVLGRIGGEFHMGGGHVPSLHDGIPLTDAMRAAASERCPGSYWLVGSLP